MSKTRIVLALLFSVISLLPASASAQKRQRDRITREEIEASPHKHLDAFQLIRNMRPHFLEPPKGVRSFGGSNAPFTPIAVYVDGRRDTGIDALKTMDPLTFEEVRYLDPTRAENEFGTMAANGAVVVKLRKVRPPSSTADTSRPPR
jgi:hypothetical protein